MWQRAARDLVIKIARAARYDGPILSIDTSDNSLNGSDRLHLNLQFFYFEDFELFGRTDNVTAPNPYSVWVGRSSEERLKSRQ